MKMSLISLWQAVKNERRSCVAVDLSKKNVNFIFEIFKIIINNHQHFSSSSPILEIASYEVADYHDGTKVSVSSS
jgi:hypothetical protein